MEKTRQPYDHATGYRRSKVNFFGRKGRRLPTAPSKDGQDRQTAPPPRQQADHSAGRLYLPDNGLHRHRNLLGRTSWERKDKLLINRK
jgi:hypothetical protein